MSRRILVAIGVAALSLAACSGPTAPSRQVRPSLDVQEGDECITRDGTKGTISNVRDDGTFDCIPVGEHRAP